MKIRTLLFIVLGIIVLSISWFYFNVFLAEPTKNKLVSDTQKLSQQETAAASTLHLILLSDTNFYYYTGSELAAGKRIVKDKLQALIEVQRKDLGDKKSLIVIKPTINASYQCVVGILDMMTTNRIERYVMQEPEPAELKLLNELQKQY
ncbi:MAG: hypothetical protein H7Y31_13705 [Chitinophagaceae bacterium]|nr:hypothetical protein [Chitinophagaceae bacterium]